MTDACRRCRVEPAQFEDTLCQKCRTISDQRTRDKARRRIDRLSRARAAGLQLVVPASPPPTREAPCPPADASPSPERLAADARLLQALRQMRSSRNRWRSLALTWAALLLGMIAAALLHR